MKKYIVVLKDVKLYDKAPNVGSAFTKQSPIEPRMAEETKEKLTRLRARRGVSTKLPKEATELLLQTPEEADIERSEVTAGLLEEKLKILNELDEAILNVCDVNEIQIEIEEPVQTTTDGILTTKRKIERYTKLFKQK